MFYKATMTMKLVMTLYVSTFFVHFIWEMWQVPFYAGMQDASHWQAIRLCTQATAGDGLIALLAYGAAACVVRNSYWVFSRTILSWFVYLSSGLMITWILERLATGSLDRWQYSEVMPVIPMLEVGLLPVLQWLMLPPLVLLLSSVYLRGLGEHDPKADEHQILNK